MLKAEGTNFNPHAAFINLKYSIELGLVEPTLISLFIKHMQNNLDQ
jgi:hypothetical protein